MRFDFESRRPSLLDYCCIILYYDEDFQRFYYIITDYIELDEKNCLRALDCREEKIN